MGIGRLDAGNARILDLICEIGDLSVARAYEAFRADPTGFDPVVSAIRKIRAQQQTNQGCLE